MAYSSFAARPLGYAVATPSGSPVRVGSDYFPKAPTANTGSEILGRAGSGTSRPTRMDILKGKAKDPKGEFLFAKSQPQLTAFAKTEDVFWQPKGSTYLRRCQGTGPGTTYKMVTQWDGQLVCSDSVQLSPEKAAEVQAEIDAANDAFGEGLRSSGIEIPPNPGEPGYDAYVAASRAINAQVTGLGADSQITKDDAEFLADQKRRFQLRQAALIGVFAVGALLVWSSRKGAR